LVLETYNNELKGKTLNLNAKVPRIAKRYEDAFATLGIEFHKTRPARLLLTRMANDPKSIMTDDTCERFERLYMHVGEALRKHRSRSAEPFR
jgi:hypothetical protein